MLWKFDFFNFSAHASSNSADYFSCTVLAIQRLSLTERMTKGLQRITFNIFQLTTFEFVNIEVVFHALYFENEVGDPQFFGISDIGNSLSDCSKSMKKMSGP